MSSLPRASASGTNCYDMTRYVQIICLCWLLSPTKFDSKFYSALSVLTIVSPALLCKPSSHVKQDSWTFKQMPSKLRSGRTTAPEAEMGLKAHKEEQKGMRKESRPGLGR